MLHSADWILIVGYILLMLLVGVILSRRAGEDLESYFVSKRNLPWWIAGTSMAATSFAADTPLYVTGVVRDTGVSGNWQWWALGFGHVMAIFLLSKLWRRSGVLTDMELTELRYSGKPAAALRGVKAFYFSVLLNCIAIAMVVVGMTKILQVMLGVDRLTAVIATTVITLTYTVLSGFWGVVITDLFQFVIAFGGAVLLAVFSVQKAGGLSSLRAMDPAALAIFPQGLLASPIEFLGTSAGIAFFAYVGVLWWNYKNADGGGIIVQRMLACKNEAHAVGSTLWFTLAHYVIRTWPWILAALASVILYPELADSETAYPRMVVEILPPGLTGLLIVSFLGAFMSTIDSQLNWGASYLTNDIYKRFIARERDDRHYVFVARLVTVLLMLLIAVISYSLETVRGIFTFILAFTSGIGLVMILRWFWWRINAWSEVAAMTASSVISSTIYILKTFYEVTVPGGWVIIITAFGSLAVWLIVTLFTPPEKESLLIAFYRRVRPAGPGWRRISVLAQMPPLSIARDLTAWGVGCVMIFALLIGLGDLFIGSFSRGVLLTAVGLVSGLLLIPILKPEFSTAKPQ